MKKKNKNAGLDMKKTTNPFKKEIRKNICKEKNKNNNYFSHTFLLNIFSLKNII